MQTLSSTIAFFPSQIPACAILQINSEGEDPTNLAGCEFGLKRPFVDSRNSDSAPGFSFQGVGVVCYLWGIAPCETDGIYQSFDSECWTKSLRFPGLDPGKRRESWHVQHESWPAEDGGESEGGYSP